MASVHLGNGQWSKMIWLALLGREQLPDMTSSQLAISALKRKQTLLLVTYYRLWWLWFVTEFATVLLHLLKVMQAHYWYEIAWHNNVFLSLSICHHPGSLELEEHQIKHHRLQFLLFSHTDCVPLGFLQGNTWLTVLGKAATVYRKGRKIH